MLCGKVRGNKWKQQNDPRFVSQPVQKERNLGRELDPETDFLNRRSTLAVTFDVAMLAEVGIEEFGKMF